MSSDPQAFASTAAYYARALDLGCGPGTVALRLGLG